MKWTSVLMFVAVGLILIQCGCGSQECCQDAFSGSLFASEDRIRLEPAVFKPEGIEQVLHVHC